LERKLGRLDNERYQFPPNYRSPSPGVTYQFPSPGTHNKDSSRIQNNQVKDDKKTWAPRSRSQSPIDPRPIVEHINSRSNKVIEELSTAKTSTTAAASNLEVPIQVNGVNSKAIVDTASMLTLISISFLNSIPDEIKYGEQVCVISLALSLLDDA